VVTRLSDRADPVLDDVWEDAARHFDEAQIGALILSIATTNLFNRTSGLSPIRRGERSSSG
jgi:alkylhydroperoxidase family enzyme